MASPLGRSVLIYGAAFAVAGAAPFLLLPILTHYLTPAEFGEIAAFLILAGLLANVAGLSAPGFVSVRYFKTPSHDFKGLVTTSLLAVCLAHIVMAVLVSAGFAHFRQALQLPLGYAMLAVLAALFVSLNLVFLSLFQCSGQPLLYLRARVVQAGGELLLCVGLLWLFTADSGSRLYSYTVAMALSAAVGLFYCYRAGYVGGKATGAHLRELLAFGVPVLPHIVAGSALTYLDRMVVSTVLGAESLGLYMVALQVGMVTIVMIEPLHRALAPWLFAQLSKADSAQRRLIVKRTYQLFGALAALGLVVAAATHALFFAIIDSRYAAARPLVAWIVLGYVLQGMYYAVVGYVLYAEKTGRLSVVTASTVATGCMLSWALTTSMGLQGAAISFALNNGLLFLLVWLVASNVVPMPWLPWRNR
jgi:O-antigen/teichoic acid export membrane protein